MPRFVLLHHDHPRGAHWDLMLEDGPILATWELPRMPEVGGEYEAKRLFDHRLHFLDFEGPLSAGQGNVTRLTRGEFETVLHTDTQWTARLSSELLRCYVELTCPDPNADDWECRFIGEESPRIGQ